MSSEPTNSLAGRDRALIWHPYTQHKTVQDPIPVVKGEGVYLVDENGRKYIDAISSWWTNLHGHAHPYIAEKIYEQARQLEHVIFAGCTHEPAVQLAEKLLPLLPGDFSKVFYSDNGSTAVEVALKMAIQRCRNKGQVSRNKVVALKNAYHGDTFGAMSVSERGLFTMAFQDYLFEVLFIEPGGDWSVLNGEWERIACFIYEPLLQGAGGMNMYEAGWLNELICRLKQAEITCIADEVMTGFGRTGHLFASGTMHHTPDIICLSKGLTGGCLPLAITACTQKIFDAFLGDDHQRTFFHGHSYTANPLACAAALASLDLLMKEDCLASIEYISQANREFVQRIAGNSRVIQPRSLGTVLAFELQSGKKEYSSGIRDAIIRKALEQGVFLRPLGNTVYIMPPYCIGPVQLRKLHDLLEKIIAEC